MSNVHDALASMLKADRFEPYIRYIRFPYFRNIRENERINFDHPITALVGPNGTNKTAILRALQGCPDYYNVGNYWFSTSMDPIGPDRHRFIYGYLAKSIGKVVEVMKTRIERGNNPDYFEPTRPILKDGMERMPALINGQVPPPERANTRWKAVEKDVLYLDFRSELSAFDKCFFHASQVKEFETLTARKNLIRRRSTYLVEALESGKDHHLWYKIERIVEPACNATPAELEEISSILGRRYESARVITHRYFNVEGKSVVLKSPNLQYSEAFAGSGEFAVTILVTAVMRAKNTSLILLDEPEVSLHPGAQRKLMRFLANQAKQSRHQIIVSTHAPEIIRDLPPEAIKVFHPNEEDGKVELVSQASDPTEAFFRLGLDVRQSLTVYVEDKLAALLVRAAIRPLGEAMNARLRIEPIPGGAASIQTRFVPTFALTGNATSLVLLDGDQYPGSIAEPSTVSGPNLAATVNAQAHGDVQLSLNGNKGKTSPEERESQLRKVLQWFYDHVDYLPETNPEVLLLILASNERVDPARAKIVWSERAHESLGRQTWERAALTAQEILAEQERALAQVSEDAPEMVQIRARVEKFIQQHPE